MRSLKIYSDCPIQDKNYDALGYARFSKKIAELLLQYQSSENLVVALCGKWGSGKTSILNMLCQELPDDKIIKIHFDPWNFTNSEQLTNQFFIQFQEGIRDTDVSQIIGECLKDYADVFNVLEAIPKIGPFLKLFPIIIKKLGNSISSKKGSLQNKKEKLETVLQTIERHIVIIIDDIDRLANDKIQLLFQLIHAVAGFSHVIYLLSFDREIICNCLRDIQKCDGAEYLEKIIQAQYDIPEIPKKKFDEIVYGDLKKIINQNDFEQQQDYFDTVYKYCVRPYLTTIRNIRQLMNKFTLEYLVIGEEVNCVDLFAVTAIQLFDNDFYTWIYRNQKFLLGKDSFALSGTIDKDKQIEEVLERINAFFAETSLSKKEHEETILCILFPYIRNNLNKPMYITQQNASDHKRLLCSDTFPVYFQLTVENITIAKKELNAILTVINSNDITVWILEKQKQNLIRECFDSIAALLEENVVSQERKRMIVTALFDSSYYLSDKRDNSFSTELGECYKLTLFLFKSMNTGQYDCIINNINTCNEIQINFIALVLRRLKFDYGILPVNADAQQQENKCNQFIAAHELQAAASVFQQKVMEVLRRSCIAKLGSLNYVLLYLNDVESPDFTLWLSEQLQHGDNAVCFITKTEILWHSYIEFGNFAMFLASYPCFSALQNVFKLIDNYKMHDGFWQNETDVIKTVILFYLSFQEHYHDALLKQDISVDGVFTLWQSAYQKTAS